LRFDITRLANQRVVYLVASVDGLVKLMRSISRPTLRVVASYFFSDPVGLGGPSQRGDAFSRRQEAAAIEMLRIAADAIKAACSELQRIEALVVEVMGRLGVEPQGVQVDPSPSLLRRRRGPHRVSRQM